MTRSVTCLRPGPVDGAGTHASALIDRYLDAQGHTSWVRFAAIPRRSPLAVVTVEMIDTTRHPGPIAADQQAALMWHVLWVHDESVATVSVLGAKNEEPTWPVAPGDTVPVPPSMALSTAGGQLGLVIRVQGTTAVISPPTHGTERFFGHNRQTIAFELGDIRVCRWKLTQSLDLTEHAATPVMVMALARSIIVRTRGSIDQLRQGDLVIIDPSAVPTLAPDGLAYVLTIERLGHTGAQ
jgi:hypothetical protein